MASLKPHSSCKTKMTGIVLEREHNKI